MRENDLPPLSIETKCTKCGGEDVGINYHDQAHCEYGCPGRWIEREHQLRCCKRCHYQWVEGVLHEQYFYI